MHYIRETDFSFKPPFMADGTYIEARASLPFVCTDAVIANMGSRVIYLAWRQAKPAEGWWVVGGSIKNGQSPSEAMAKNFQRETSLELSEARFELLADAINFTQWTVEEQISNVHLPFKLELTDSELMQAQVKLDQKEYEQARGLRAFTLEGLQQLIEEGIGYPQPILYYDAIFGTTAYSAALSSWRRSRARYSDT